MFEELLFSPIIEVNKGENKKGYNHLKLLVAKYETSILVFGCRRATITIFPDLIPTKSK